MNSTIDTAKKAKNILVIKLRALGDTVISTAFLAELRKQYPQARITFLGPSKWISVLKSNPDVDERLVWDGDLSFIPRTLQFFKLSQIIRKQNFDLVLALHAGGTATKFAKVANAKVKVVHNHDLQKPNEDSDLPIPNKGRVQPAIQRDLDVIRALGLHPSPNPATKLRLTEAEKTQARAMIAKMGARTPILALGLGASRPTKIWPMEYYFDLAKKWNQMQGGSVFAFFSENERPLWEKLKGNQNAPWLFPVCESDIRTMMALLQQCRFFVGNDSGPKHLAAALGLPTLTLFGPEHPLEWHPYDQTKHGYIFTDNLACRTISVNGQPAWCGLEVCTIENHKCLRDWRPEQVWPRLQKLLDLW